MGLIGSHIVCSSLRIDLRLVMATGIFGRNSRSVSAPRVRFYLARPSKHQIDNLDKLIAVDDAFTPDWIEIGERLFRDSFLGGFPRGPQFLDAIARSDEHVPEFREVLFVAERAVPRNDPRVVVRERENFIGSGNRAIDVAAR